MKREILAILIVIAVGAAMAGTAVARERRGDAKPKQEAPRQVDLSGDSVQDVVSRSVGMNANLVLKNGTERCGKIMRATGNIVVLVSGRRTPRSSCFNHYESVILKSEIVAVELNRGTIAGIDYGR